MGNLRVTSDGPFGRVEDAETGEMIKGVVSAKIDMSAGSKPRLFLEVVDIDVDIAVDKENVIRYDSRTV